MAFREFSDVTIFINSVYILDAQTISISYAQNDTNIHNQSGFAGISVGTSEMTVEVTSAVPREGLPVNITKLAQDREVVEVEFFVGDMSAASKGYIRNPSVSKSLDAQTEFSFTYIGTPATLS